jgi:hypothetical protein
MVTSVVHSLCRCKVDTLPLYFLFSYLHQNISMRFLTCEPNLWRQLNYTDEADIFYRSPSQWLAEKFFSGNATDNLPSHFVMFDELLIKNPSLMNGHRTNYDLCARFFHTHFPQGRISSYIIVMCHSEWTRRNARYVTLENSNGVSRKHDA